MRGFESGQEGEREDECDLRFFACPAGREFKSGADLSYAGVRVRAERELFAGGGGGDGADEAGFEGLFEVDSERQGTGGAL